MVAEAVLVGRDLDVEMARVTGWCSPRSDGAGLRIPSFSEDATLTVAMLEEFCGRRGLCWFMGRVGKRYAVEICKVVEAESSDGVAAGSVLVKLAEVAGESLPEAACRCVLTVLSVNG